MPMKKRKKILMPIFHQKLCWVPNANKKETNNVKSTCPTRPNVPSMNYIPPACIGVCVGMVGVCVGSQGFLDTNMLV